jgi:excisionase family DNA binding protein
MAHSRSFRFRSPEQFLLPWAPQQTISVERAADILHCSTRTVTRLIELRDIEAYQLRPGVAGSAWRINYDSLLRYLGKIHQEAGVAPRFDL